jgi:hypothetical protein
LPDIPNFRPSDRVTDPELFAIARRRWPGHRVTSEMLADAARIEGRPLHVKATRENVNAGLAEIAKDRRGAEHKAGVTRSYARMGFNPEADYRTKG